MYSQEEFFKEQIEKIHETRDAIGEAFERLQREERAKAEISGNKRRYTLCLFSFDMISFFKKKINF